MKRTTLVIIASLVLVLLVSLLLNTLVRKVAGDDQLMKAAQDGNARTIPELVKNGANVNYRFEGNVTPLFLASSNGHTECVIVLLKLGADPNIRNYQGLDSLDVAANDKIKSIIKPHHLARPLE